MLNTVKNEPADVSSVSPSSEQMLLRIAFTDCSDEGLMLETSASSFFTVFNIHSATITFS